MLERKDPAQETQSESKEPTKDVGFTFVTHTLKIFSRPHSDIVIHELSNGDIASFVAEGAGISKAILATNQLVRISTKTNYGDYQPLTLFSDGQIIAQKKCQTHYYSEATGEEGVDISYDRVLIDPYKFYETIILEKGVSFNGGSFAFAKPISTSRYVIRINSYRLKVYDAKTHASTSSIKIGEGSESCCSATFLDNGKTALLIDGCKIKLFKYSEDKVTEEKNINVKEKLNLAKDQNIISTLVFSVSEKYFLTIVSCRVSKRHPKELVTLLQLWDSDSGECVDEPIKIPKVFKQSVSYNMLLDGSILCATEDNQICLIDMTTGLPHYYDPGCEIVGLKVLATDRIVLVSRAFGEPLSNEVATDVRILELDRIFDFKKPHITKEIMDSVLCLSRDVVGITVGYVGCDSDFRVHKHPICGTFFQRPKSIVEKRVEERKAFGHGKKG